MTSNSFYLFGDELKMQQHFNYSNKTYIPQALKVMEDFVYGGSKTETHKKEHKDYIFIDESDDDDDLDYIYGGSNNFHHDENYLYVRNNSLQKQKEEIYFSDSTSADEDEDVEDNASDDYDDSYGGAPTKKTKPLKKEKKLSSKMNKTKKSSIMNPLKSKDMSKLMSVLPTFISVTKGRIIYNNKTRMSLKKLKTTSKQVILGTIIDLKRVADFVMKLNTNIIEKENQPMNKHTIEVSDLKKFISSYDVIPLFFSMDNRQIIFKNKKTNFFSLDSKLMFLTFKVKVPCTYYLEDILEDPQAEFVDINKKINDKYFMIAHYIFENYYFIAKNNDTYIDMYKAYLIDPDSAMKNLEECDLSKSSISYTPNNRKLNLSEIVQMVDRCSAQLSTFTKN